jgi:UPF0716 protein FxsA
VLRALIALLVVIWVCAFAILVPLGFYGSWKLTVLEIVATALLGVAVIRWLRGRFDRTVVAKLVAGEFPGDALLDALLIFLAGVFLILPGVISDVAGLLLLIPPIRWLLVALLRRRYMTCIRDELGHLRLSDNPSVANTFPEFLDDSSEDEHLDPQLAGPNDRGTDH